MAAVKSFGICLSETVPESLIQSDLEYGSRTFSDSDSSVEDDGNSSMGDSNELEMAESDLETEGLEKDIHGTDDNISNCNPGWADAMAKILKLKKPKGKKSVVLAKAKKLNMIKKTDKLEPELGFEILGEIKEEKPDIGFVKQEEVIPVKRKKKEWEAKGRVKPSPIDRNREKALSKIATKGVVQLFNAVRQHQKTVDFKLKEVGPSEIRREKVMKSIDKRAFLDVLMGSTKSEVVESPVKVDPEIKEENVKPATWQVLQSDFMMGGKLKDWDKQD